MSNFQEYMNSLLSAETYQESFLAYNQYIESMDYKSAIYTFIPGFYFHNKPGKKIAKFSASKNSNFDFLNYYTEARLDKYDNIVEKVRNGYSETIDWAEEYKNKQLTKKQERLFLTMRNEYRLRNGLSIPTLSNNKELGIAVASIVSDDNDRFFKLKKIETHTKLRKSTIIFHNHVMANAFEFSSFIKPLLYFSETEKKVIKALAKGLTIAGIANEVGTTVRYTDKVILSIRKKIGGETVDGKAAISTRLLIYYIGLMQLDKKI